MNEVCVLCCLSFSLFRFVLFITNERAKKKEKHKTNTNPNPTDKAPVDKEIRLGDEDRRDS